MGHGLLLLSKDMWECMMYIAFITTLFTSGSLRKLTHEILTQAAAIASQVGKTKQSVIFSRAAAITK